MIYIHGLDGSTTEYSPSSHINYILEYNCSGKLENYRILENTSRRIFVACPDMTYAKDWMDRHEGHSDYVLPSGILACVGISIIRLAEGTYSWWYRGPHKIDWSKDYHFYVDHNKQIEIIDHS